MSNLLIKNTVKTIAYEAAVIMGLIEDGKVTPSKVYGYKATSATTALQAVNATTHTPQTAGAQRSIKSASANDTAAGTGARTVRLTYLTSSYVRATEDLTLNGITAVATVASTIMLVEQIRVLTAGTGLSNAGILSFHSNNAGGATTIASIVAGENMLSYAHHYVPDGWTCYITNMVAGATVVGGVARLVVTEFTPSISSPDGPALFHPVGGSTPPLNVKNPMAVTGPAYISMVDTPLAATASVVHSWFEYVDIDD